jgi:hypothetical protein
VRLVLVLGDPDAVYVCCEDQFHFRTRTVWCLGVSDPHRSMLKFKLASLLQIRGIANMDQLCFSLDVFTVLAPDVFFFTRSALDDGIQALFRPNLSKVCSE